MSTLKRNKNIIIAYIPVLHHGYYKFFKKYPNIDSLYIFSDKVIGEFEHLIKDIRSLSPLLIKKSIESWKIFNTVNILSDNHSKYIINNRVPIIIPDDDITNELVHKYFINNKVKKDSIFLRWDKKTSITPGKINPDVKMSRDKFDINIMKMAFKEGLKSKDWWRRIGAIVIKDNKIIYKIHNKYVPSDQIANDEGDPRSNFKSGINIESSLALHAEASIVAWAAREGISLKGAYVYVDTFPCPPCAKQLAYSGITKLYYHYGYKVLDGERILKSQGVEIIFVDIK